MTLYISTKDKKEVIVALQKEGKVLDQMVEENEFGSQVLLPLIHKILRKNNLDFKDLTEIEVDPGPGSFTGLRVGASVAQALGFALDIPVNGKKSTPVELAYE